jgi:hypothetical protein
MSAAVASAVCRARDQDWALHGPVWAWPVCQAAGCLSNGSDRRRPIRAHGRHRRYAEGACRVARPPRACRYTFPKEMLEVKGIVHHDNKQCPREPSVSDGHPYYILNGPGRGRCRRSQAFSLHLLRSGGFRRWRGGQGPVPLHRGYVAGAGTFTLYPVIRFDDDSMLFLKGSGTGTVDGARTNFTGTVAVIGGRKRFEAVRGDGKLTGTRYTPLSEGADLVSEYTVNLAR